MPAGKSLTLRPYQSEAVRSLFKWWKERKGEYPLIVLPTGAGKTFTIVALIKELKRTFQGVRVLVLAHRRELLTQFEKTIFDIWPFAPVGIFCAALGRRELAEITLASRDSISRKPETLGRFDLVIVDEAHNIDTTKAETGYRRIIGALQKANPKLALVGLTATPFRDGCGYIYGGDHLFAGVAHEVRLRWMIENGYLVKPVSKVVDEQIDTAGLRTQAGDFNRKQLDERVSHRDTVSRCVDEWRRVGYDQGRRSTLFFAVSLNHAALIADELADRGLYCPIVAGDMPKDERDEILADFAAGKFPGIVNVGVLTEGTDIPCVDCIALLRPTKSLKLFIQMIGRGLRLHPGKENCLVLDFGGNLQRFGPVDIAEPAQKRGYDGDRTKDCPECQSVIGLYKKKCPECGAQLSAPASKECPGCGEENAPGRRDCIACGYEWPIELESEASSDAVISSDLQPKLQDFPVMRIQAEVRHARRDGRAYLCLIFITAHLNRFRLNLMVGWPGRAGEIAERKLRHLMGPNAGHGVPDTPEEAVQLHRDGWLIAPVERIYVDLNSKWQNITRVDMAPTTLAPTEETDIV